MKRIFFFLYISVLSVGTYSADGKLISTAGLVQIEGAGGGGLVPWATLAGYDSREQLSLTPHMTRVDLDDYRLNTLGVAASFYDKLELSLSEQRFDLKTIGGEIKQNIVGIKYRIYGDVVYSSWPQLALALQHKKLDDGDIADALGAKSSDSGTDIYLALTKVHLGILGGYNMVWNLTARATKANELGLLGFGSAKKNSYEVMFETSVGVLLSRHVAIGAEYRQKPDNLGLDEDDWFDVFISYIPSKKFNVTLAWADLGTIAGAPSQTGFYLSFSGQL